jgi:hypothetical protein
MKPHVADTGAARTNGRGGWRGVGDFISSLNVGWLWAVYRPSAAFGFASDRMVLGAFLMLQMARVNHGRA